MELRDINQEEKVILQHNAITSGRYDFSSCQLDILFMVLAQLEIGVLEYTIHTGDIEKIKSAYSDYTLVFDRDKIAQAEKNMKLIRSVFLIIAGISSSLLILFLGFIFTGILRENSRMFALFHMIGVNRSYIWSTIYIELGGLAIVGSILGTMISIIGSNHMTAFVTARIASIGL